RVKPGRRNSLYLWRVDRWGTQTLAIEFPGVAMSLVINAKTVSSTTASTMRHRRTDDVFHP
ncbi:MAG: hypothetical protein MI861_12225, partial [Pirellulales bacterium]|nr:hypothetical protein [Pirellulales bacterium]